MHLTIKKEDHINAIIKNFDFKKVEKVMTFLKWDWVMINKGFSIPNLSDLKKEARRLLNELADSDDDTIWIASGGLKASKGYDSLVLEFVVSDYTSEWINNGVKYDAAKLKKERLQKVKKIYHEEEKLN